MNMYLVRLTSFAIWTVLSIPSSTASPGPLTRTPLDGSGGLQQSSANVHGFVSIELGISVATWFPLDVDVDGDWEFGIAGSGGLVGVFDPDVAAWVLGPDSLGISATPWTSAASSSHGALVYYYFTGDSVRMLDPVADRDSALWASPHPPANAYVWGPPSQHEPMIVFVSGSSGYVHDLTTGVQKSSFSYATSRRHHVYRYNGIDNHQLAVEYGYRYAISDWGYSNLTIDQGFVLLSDTGTVVSSHRYYWYSGPHGPNTYGSRLDHIEIEREGNTGSDCYLLRLSDPLRYFTARWVVYRQQPGMNWEKVLWWDGNNRSAVAADLDGGGTSSWIIPLASGGWERRDLATGVVLDSIPGMPNVNLRRGPLLGPATQDVFYFGDSTLHIHRIDINSGVFDDPEVWNETAEAITIDAHPNPFNSAVTMTWNLRAHVSTLVICNILGQVVKSIDASQIINSTYTWDARDDSGRELASGVYFARIVADNAAAVTKIVLLR